MTATWVQVTPTQLDVEVETLAIGAENKLPQKLSDAGDAHPAQWHQVLGVSVPRDSGRARSLFFACVNVFLFAAGSEGNVSSRCELALPTPCF